MKRVSAPGGGVTVTSMRASRPFLTVDSQHTATVTSPLVPWNTCGATHAGVLGISTLVYLPYCFFNLISPVMTLTFAYLSIKIAKSGPVHKLGN